MGCFRERSASALRDIVRDYVFEALGGADGVLAAGETGFVKKGEHSAGLARQYSGAAGLRWTIEECFGRGKSDLGLDHCDARSWRGWHRHVTLVMAAAAFLAKLAAELRRTSVPGNANERSPAREAAA